MSEHVYTAEWLELQPAVSPNGAAAGGVLFARGLVGAGIEVAPVGFQVVADHGLNSTALSVHDVYAADAPLQTIDFQGNRLGRHVGFEQFSPLDAAQVVDSAFPHFPLMAVCTHFCTCVQAQ